MDYAGDEEQDNSAIYNLNAAFKNRKQKSNVSSKASSVKEENDDSAEIRDESQLEPKDEVVPMEEDLSNDWK